MSAPALRLTFGCSNLGSDLGLAASRALVEGAYECGYRHFDAAPSYGNGLAEQILGEALRPVRSQVTIVTKTGIGHPKAASGLRAVRRVFLPIKKAFPGLWKAAAGSAQRSVVARGKFGREDVLGSVAESLRRLQTDRIDALLLHEVLPEDIDDALFETLQGLTECKSVAAIGLGTTVQSALRITAQHSGRFGVVQVNHHWGAFMPQLLDGPHRLNSHRWLKSGLQVVTEEPLRGALEPDLRAALADAEQAPMLLLAAAMAQNPHGQLLVSSSKLPRLRAYAAAARTQEFAVLATRLNAHFLRVATPTQASD